MPLRPNQFRHDFCGAASDCDIDDLRVRGGIQGDLRDECAGLPGERGKGRCRIDDARCADDQQHLARADGGHASVKVVRVERFPEPDDMRAQQSAARGAEGEQRGRHSPVLLNLPALRAADLPDVAVNLGEFSGAGGGMQPVHVLRDQPETLNPLFQLNQRMMSGVGALGGDEFAPPVVPFPDETGIAREGLRRCQLFGPVVPPEPVGAAKRRHAAVRRDAGSRQDGDRAGAGQSGPDFLDADRLLHASKMVRPEGLEPPTF